MQEITTNLNLTFNQQIKRLEFIYETAEKPTDKINAIKEINKLLGYYNEHNQQKNPEPKELTLEEIKLINTVIEEKY
jgi:hypothetical protein